MIWNMNKASQLLQKTGKYSLHKVNKKCGHLPKHYFSSHFMIHQKQLSVTGAFFWVLGNFSDSFPEHLRVTASDDSLELLSYPFTRQPHKMVKQTQTIRRQQPTNCLSVFDHFVRLVLKGLKAALKKLEAFNFIKKDFIAGVSVSFANLFETVIL